MPGRPEGLRLDLGARSDSFHKLMTAADSLTGAGDAAAKLAELRAAALDDENGSALQAKLANWRAPRMFKRCG